MEMAEAAPEQRPHAQYAIPSWSAAPYRPFFLDVIKNGVRLERLDVSKKEAHMFGRTDTCDFVLGHPSISRFHAVLQFRNDGDAFLYDLGSLHGSFVNKSQIKSRIYTQIHLGDVISFGHSSRLYTFAGQAELMHLDEEAEITWETYEGQLTDRQENMRSKKQIEEVANSKKEICAIKRIDISQAGCSRDSIQRKPSSLTTIDKLPEDTILEVLLRLPSIGCVIRAACSCSLWRDAVSSSPLFRRKFLGIHPAPLLGLFFDAPSNYTPAFPTFVPVRNTIVDVPVAVRWGDFFTTELQRRPVVPPNWTLSDVRGGLMLLVNSDDVLLVVDPLQGLSEGYFDPHEVRILMDYHGTNPRMLPPHLVCDEACTGRFTLIYLAHDVSRVRAAVFGSSIGGRGFSLPWFEVAPRQNQLDEEGGWLYEGVQAGAFIYWLSANHQYVVILNAKLLVFSLEYLQDLNLNNFDSYAFGETVNGKLCLAYILGPMLVIMCSQTDHSVSGPWEILHEASVQDLAVSHGDVRVSGIRKGIVYLMASRVFYQYGIPCWIATYDMQTLKLEVKCQWMSADHFQPFHLPWPRSLSCQGQESAAKVQRCFQKFMKMNEVKDIVLVKAIYSYQIEIMKNPHDYKLWFEYISLEEKHGDKNKVRGIYEQALSSVPVEEEKWFWESYISLWLSYAIYEEEGGNIQSARNVYSRCLSVIPHQQFTFSVVWTMAADLEIRQKDVEAARQILRVGIEKHPTAKLYRRLVHIEYWMNNCDAWRGLFETFLEWSPMNCCGWMEYAEKEHSIGEVERARAIYERAIQQPSLDLPMQVLLKDYLFFEITENEVENARGLFEKLLIVTNEVEAWISYAKYEASDDSNNSEMGRVQRCRTVFERALAFYSDSEEVDKKAKLVDAWREHETSFGVCGTAISPSSTLKRRRVPCPPDISTEKRRKKDSGDEHRRH